MKNSLNLIVTFALLVVAGFAAVAANYTRFDDMIIKSTMSVGSNTTPNSKAILDVFGTGGGLLLPRLTTVNRDAITSPPAGLHVYNSTTNKLNVYSGTAWNAVHDSGTVLSIAQGGTNNASLAVTAGGTLYTDGSKMVNVGAGNSGDVLTSNGASAPTWSTPTSAPSSSLEFSNCSIAASVGSSALTVALKDSAGSDPSGGSACKIGFRNATATTGTYTQVSTSAAVSVVVSNGSSLGCLVGTACNVYVYAIYDGSNVVLGVSGERLRDIGSVVSSTAEGGAGGADTFGTIYTTAAQTSKPVRLIGRVVIAPAASFAWTSSPTEVSNIPIDNTAYSAAGKLRIEYAYITGAASSNCTSDPCTISAVSSSWLSSVTRNNTGDYSLVLNGGFFGTEAMCSCTGDKTGSTKSIICGSTGPGAYNFECRSPDGTNGTADCRFMVICIGKD